MLNDNLLLSINPTALFQIMCNLVEISQKKSISQDKLFAIFFFDVCL